jgi:hypothetical protein
MTTPRVYTAKEVFDDKGNSIGVQDPCYMNVVFAADHDEEVGKLKEQLILSEGNCLKLSEEAIALDEFNKGLEKALSDHKEVIEALQSELNEQARLNGIGSEREARLESELENAKYAAKKYSDELIAANKLSRSRLAKLESLQKYVRHDGLCAFVGGYGYCSCGLEPLTKTATQGAS